jgi:hypothetical protein
VPLPSGRSYYEYLRAPRLVADQAAPMQAVALDAPGSMTETSERGLVGGQGGGHPRLRQRPAAALGHEMGEGADAGGDDG